MGNRLVYRTREPDKIAQQLEERVRADLGAASPVPYEVHDTRALAQGGGLSDLGRLMIGSHLESIATIVFRLPWHRPASLAVIASRVGLTAQCGSLLYEVDFDGPTGGPIGFQKKAFVAGAGADPATVARLNAVPDLGKRLDKVLRERSAFGAMVMEQPTHFAIEPAEQGSRMLLRTLGRPTGLLMNNATTDAGEVLGIARLIEGALR